MINLKSKAREVHDHGYCVIESAYDDQECEGMRAIFDALCVKKGGLSAEQPSVGFHPLLEWGPGDVALFREIGSRGPRWKRCFRTMFGSRTAAQPFSTTRILTRFD